MKNVFLVLFSAALLGTITSCNSDSGNESCDDIVCQNGGTCDDGTCECPAGFTGEFCETQTAITLNSSIQFTGTIDGASTSFVSGQSGFQPYTSSSASIGSISTYEFTGGIIDPIGTARSAGVARGTMTLQGGTPTLADMQDLWAVGTFNYTAEAVDGAGVEYSDGTTYWTSWNSSGTQPTTSSFEITDVGTGTGVFGEEFTKARVEVTCVLYDDNGNTVNLEGVFVVRIDHD